MKKSITFFGLLMVSTAVLAGGSIFGGHKARTSNPEGVSSIGLHICGSLNCPDVILQTGDCFTVPNASVRYGVCVCDDGYYGEGGTCKPCPTGTYSDGVGGCTACPDGTYRDSERRRCVACPEEPSCPLDNECCELEGPLDVCGRKTPVLGFKDNAGNCVSCSVEHFNAEYDAIPATEEECAKCGTSDMPRKRTSLGLCMPIDCWEDNFRDVSGNCYPCDFAYMVNSFPETCSKCGNKREMITGNYRWYDEGIEYCAPKCQPGQFRADDGRCWDCDDEELDTPIMNTNHCTCSNREVIKGGTNYFFCAKAPEGQFWNNESLIYLCDTTGTPGEYMEVDGISYLPSVNNVKPTQCAKCGDKRIYVANSHLYGDPTEDELIYGWDGSACVIADCGEGKFLDTWANYEQGKCVLCSDSESHYTIPEHSVKCATYGYPRFIDEHFVSYLCETDYEYATEEECAQCGSQYTYNIGTGKCSKVS